MYSISVLLLLAGVNYPDVSHALAGRIARRQSSTAVELWGACNFPSEGINGPLPCASGECICKDECKCSGDNQFHVSGVWCLISPWTNVLMRGTAYSQCREQIGGSWAQDSSWECQQPGDSATGSSTSSNPNPSSTTPEDEPSNTTSGDEPSGTTSGDGPSSAPVSQDDGTGNTGSQAATIGDCTSASVPAGWDGVASTSVSRW